jgi:GntR family transcriptional regulator
VTQTAYACAVAQRPAQTVPKYRQIAHDLQARIERGDYPPGSRLPTKAELMAQHGVALNTVDRAIDELRKAGLAETLQGVGTFVRTPEPPDDSGAAYQAAVLARLDELTGMIRQLDERVTGLEELAKGHDDPSG